MTVGLYFFHVKIIVDYQKLSQADSLMYGAWIKTVK